MTNYPKALLDTMVREVVSFGKRLLSKRANGGSDGNITVVMAPEPFLNPFSHSRGGAYPHPTSWQVTPGAPTFIYTIDPEWTPGEFSYF